MRMNRLAVLGVLAIIWTIAGCPREMEKPPAVDDPLTNLIDSGQGVPAAGVGTDGTPAVDTGDGQTPPEPGGTAATDEKPPGGAADPGGGLAEAPGGNAPGGPGGQVPAPDPAAISELQYIGLLANLANTLDRFGSSQIDYLRILLQIVAGQTGAPQFQVVVGTLVAGPQGWSYSPFPADRLVVTGHPSGDFEYVVAVFVGDNSTGSSSFAINHQVDFTVRHAAAAEPLRVESAAADSRTGGSAQRRLSGVATGVLINSQFTGQQPVPANAVLRLSDVVYSELLQFIGPLGDHNRYTYALAGEVRSGAVDVIRLDRRRQIDRYGSAYDRVEVDSSTGAFAGAEYRFRDFYIRRTLGLGLDELSTHYVAQGELQRGGAAIGAIQFAAPPPQAGIHVPVLLNLPGHGTVELLLL